MFLFPSMITGKMAVAFYHHLPCKVNIYSIETLICIPTVIKDISFVKHKISLLYFFQQWSPQKIIYSFLIIIHYIIY